MNKAFDETQDHSASRFAARAGVLASELPGGAALLDMQAGKYYSLNAVGALVWQQIQAPASLQSLAASVAETFDVELHVCRADIMVLLKSLTAAGLVEISVVNPLEALI